MQKKNEVQFENILFILGVQENCPKRYFKFWEHAGSKDMNVVDQKLQKNDDNLKKMV